MKTYNDVLMDKVIERNNKPEQEINDDKVNRPTHYKNGNKDLFDELYERLYHDERLYTGREVFITVMKFVAERYIRRYPNKNEEDLEKGIYTLERLKGYERLEESDVEKALNDIENGDTIFYQDTEEYLMELEEEE